MMTGGGASDNFMSQRQKIETGALSREGRKVAKNRQKRVARKIRLAYRACVVHSSIKPTQGA